MLTKGSLLLFWLVWPVTFLYLQRRRCARVLVLQGEEVLLVRGLISDGKWSLPGGGAKKDESLAGAAIRELREELGLAIEETHMQEIGPVVYMRYGHEHRFYCYVASLDKKPELKRQKCEIASACWFLRSDLGDSAGHDTILALQAWNRQCGEDA